MKRRLLRNGSLMLLFLGLVLSIWVFTVVSPDVGENTYTGPPTEEKKRWSFGFVGDTHIGLGSSEQFEEVLDQMKSEDVEFLLHLGDLVNRSESDQAWDELTGLVEQRQIRLMPIVGNHDKSKAYDDRGEIRFQQYFPYLQKTFYHFRHRGINFLMLNSEHSLAPWSEQGQFLRWRLKHHPGSTVVCLHRPVFTCWRRRVGAQYARRLWLHGNLKNTDTLMVLSGHHPYYERTKPLDQITYVVSGGGGNKLGYSPEVPNGQTARFEPSGHFGIVDVYSNHLQVRVLGLDTVPLDTFALELRPSTIPPGAAGNRLSTELPPWTSLKAIARRNTFPGEVFGQPRLARPW